MSGEPKAERAERHTKEQIETLERELLRERRRNDLWQRTARLGMKFGLAIAAQVINEVGMYDLDEQGWKR